MQAMAGLAALADAVKVEEHALPESNADPFGALLERTARQLPLNSPDSLNALRDVLTKVRQN